MTIYNNNLLAKLPPVRGNYKENANLAKNTWFGVGGNAEILFKPDDIEDLSFFLKNKPSNIKITIIGACSNLLIKDNGIEGVTIKLGKNFNYLNVENTQITAGAACLNYNASLFAKDNCLTGFEFLIGIPGSIGGSLAMNAGAYNEEISSKLIQAELINFSGDICYLDNSEIGYKYRGNNLTEDYIFTSAKFLLEKSSLDLVSEKMSKINAHKSSTQPLYSKTCGSSFMNPPGMKAWKLIDEAGCRDLKVGGAKLSEIHCNFIINTGTATALDIETLGEIVKARVLEKFGVELKWEIKHIGN